MYDLLDLWARDHGFLEDHELVEVQPPRRLPAEEALRVRAWMDARRRARKGYDPNEPRVPAGSPEGGQWTSEGGGAVSPSGYRSAEAVRVALFSGQLHDPVTAPAGGREPYRPDPMTDANHDGLTDAARVGVAGDESPGDTVPRLPNLTADERQVETRFADDYEKDPGGLVAKYMAQVATSKTPNTFGTDDVKILSPDYDHQKDNQALYNYALHQTANAVAKVAFEQYVRDVASKLPPEQRTLLFTAGGCSAGKGFCLTGVESTAKLASQVGAIWDSAGEQNGTELNWAMGIATKYGMKPIFVYVDADPMKGFSDVIKRAKDRGRMVDADAYADSYGIGARNFHAFYQRHQSKAEFVFLSRRSGKVELLHSFPSAALRDRRGRIASAARRLLAEAVFRGDATPAIARGGSLGLRLWHRKVYRQ